MDKLNYFEPYDTDPGHEDQLTRAYLVVLRLVPMALADFLDLVREDQRQKGYDPLLPPLSETGGAVQAQTQTSKLPEDRSHGFSLLMTNEHFEPTEPVGVRGSGARYDGVLTFEQHVLTLENKPHVRDVWEGQLSPDWSDDEEVPLTFQKCKPLVVTWKTVIDRLASLQAQGHLPPASAGLVSDFLEYVEEYFDYLNPYHNFRVCRRSTYRLGQRCRQILETVGEESRVERDGDAEYKLQLDGKPARSLYLGARVDADKGLGIRTAVHPADLTSQARAFYDSVDREGVLQLDRGESLWSLAPNLHLSYQGTHIVYSSANLDPGPYIDYWRAHRDFIGQASGDNTAMETAVSRLVEDDLLTESDFEQFEKEFLETGRNHVNINPGMSFWLRWPLERARKLDESGEFEAEFRSKVEPVLDLWGQGLPGAAE